MPVFGVGTFRLKEKTCYESVQSALLNGYLLIDTASIYKNEEEVGAAIRASLVPRETLFVTTKISPYQTGYDGALTAINDSLQRLDVGYIDLVLMHWPGSSGIKSMDPLQLEKRLSTWQALEAAKKSGQVRSIGVSNFAPRHLDHLCSSPLISITPAVNQIEIHPYYPQLEVVSYCRSKNIALQAYSSLGQGNLLNNPEVLRIATDHKCNAAQVCLRWALQHEYAVIPRSSNSDRIRDNALAADGVNLTLSEEDMKSLDCLHVDNLQKFCWDPESVI
jgi:diketogulonate reductase-like aldo/keto reductase